MRSTLPLLLLAAAMGCDPTPAPSTDAAADTASDAAADASADAAPLPSRAECNPLGYDDACMLPFPSAFYQGDTLQLPAAALPVSLGRLSRTDGERAPLDPAAWNRIDGFSPNGALLAYFPERIDPRTLVPPAEMARSVTAMASTAIVDMTTGERVAHFSEVDATVAADQPQVVILRPAQRLTPGHRYAVAITRAARTAAGGVPTVSPGFRALLDGAAQRDPRLMRLAPRYTDIFAALGRAGIQRADLLLAWDFTTATERFLTAPVVAMRDRALAMVGERGAGFTITQVEEDYNANILRRISGTVQVPLFLTAPTPTTAGSSATPTAPPASSACRTSPSSR